MQMNNIKKTIKIDDILHPESYKKVRKEKKTKIVETKRNRRLSVGPYATFFFENYETIWHQIHEMIYIEKGVFQQAQEEIEAYRSLVPSGSEIVATLMFELDVKEKREIFLRKVSGIENCIKLIIGEDSVLANSEHDVERTRSDGKTSAVHFLHFPLSNKQKELIKDFSQPFIISFDHTEYFYSEKINDNLRNSLISDLD